MVLAKEGFYIGIDIGTGSARACLIDHHGEIVDVASENIGLWQPEQEYYVRVIPAASKNYKLLNGGA